MHPKTRLPSPYRFPADTNYVVLRKILIGGVQLQPGDLLPVDSPARTIPNRLEALVRMRYLTPQVTAAVSEEAPPAEPSVKMTPVPVMDISVMTGPQLIKACKQLGLPVHGNKDQLRKRLRNALG